MSLNIILIFLFLLVRVKVMMLFHINIVHIVHIILDRLDGIAIIFYWLDEIPGKCGICVNGILRQCEWNQDKNFQSNEEIHLKVYVPSIFSLRSCVNLAILSLTIATVPDTLRKLNEIRKPY